MTSTISRPANEHSKPIQAPPVGSDSRAANGHPTPEGPSLREPNSHATIEETTPMGQPSRGPNSRPAIVAPTPRRLAPDGALLAAHQAASDAHRRNVGGDQPGRDRAASDRATPEAASLLDPALSLAADFLDDIERVKIANENRLRALLGGTKEDEAEARYAGLADDHPVVAKYAEMVDALGKIEHDAVLTLQRLMRKHPLGPWVKAQRGIGDKQAARLLASIGDPYWRPEIVREDGTVIPAGPRTISALWAYCGLHVLPAAGQPTGDAQGSFAGGGDSSTGGDSGHVHRDAQRPPAGVAARRRKGEQANWSTKAKTRAYLVAQSCLKQIDKDTCPVGEDKAAMHAPGCNCSPFRKKYDERRARTAATHPDWTDKHAMTDALRVSSKEILKHLWRAGREWHLSQKESS